MKSQYAYETRQQKRGKGTESETEMRSRMWGLFERTYKLT